jgi:hypothetical protein
MTAQFIVRAQLADSTLKDAFERWYRDEHLPEALALFNARRAWRGWSAIDPLVHYAYYEFEDLASARGVVGSPGLKRLTEEFEAAWGNKVARSREVLAIAQSLES